ncbi:MAG: porin [Telluria sp.]
MKQALFALTAATFACTAGAQAPASSNVSVYGLLDAGVQYTTNADSAKGGATRVVSGGMNASRWGVRGTEDLGGGVKAVFNLEGGILLDTGSADGVLFKRQAYVGLENRFGRVVLGRSFTTVYDFMLAFDPMGYAPSYSWVLAGSATGANKYGMTPSFDNLVKYQGQFGDFKVGATVGLGEQPGASANSAKYALGGVYAHGPLSLAATFERINGNTVVATGQRDETNAAHLAGAFSAGDYKIYAGMRGFKLASGKAATAELRANTYWSGVAYKAMPALTLTGAVYYQDIRNVAAGADADPVMLVVRARYALSKRTDVYTTFGHVKGSHGKLVGLSRDEAGFDTEQTGLTVGIQHRF